MGEVVFVRFEKIFAKEKPSLGDGSIHILLPLYGCSATVAEVIVGIELSAASAAEDGSLLLSSLSGFGGKALRRGLIILICFNNIFLRISLDV